MNCTQVMEKGVGRPARHEVAREAREVYHSIYIFTGASGGPPELCRGKFWGPLGGTLGAIQMKV